MREGTAAEFSAIRNYPHAEVKHYPNQRVSSTFVRYLGTPVAESHTTFRFGKPVSTTYYVDEVMLKRACPDVLTREKEQD